MHPRFQLLADQFHPALERLLAMAPVVEGKFPRRCDGAGVYLFTDAGAGHLYVGRSRNIRRRYGLHCNRGAQDSAATFAFQLAREATGRMQPSYQQGDDSRAGLMRDPTFAAAFAAAKGRIRRMEFRFVEEEDPTLQYLLEVYVSVVLQTPYNDFRTH